MGGLARRREPTGRALSSGGILAAMTDDIGRAEIAGRQRHGRVTVRPDADHPAARRAGQTEDQALLERGTRSDFLDTDPWRALRILAEFVEGFDALAEVGPAVTVFGSARTPPGDATYELARETGARFARQGFAVITGGGPGIMEAANRGCQEAGGLSVGCNIELPHEQGLNPYVDLGVEFRYFFARKVMFVKYADAFVIFPGGFGTLDELFEALTLIQTKKIRDFPIVLVGSDYWSGLIDWIRDRLVAEAAIDKADLDLLRITDDPEEACRIVQTYVDGERARAARTAPGTQPIDEAEVRQPRDAAEAES